jgi:hypothetical protein
MSFVKIQKNTFVRKKELSNFFGEHFLRT